MKTLFAYFVCCLINFWNNANFTQFQLVCSHFTIMTSNYSRASLTDHYPVLFTHIDPAHQISIWYTTRRRCIFKRSFRDGDVMSSWRIPIPTRGARIIRFFRPIISYDKHAFRSQVRPVWLFVMHVYFWTRRRRTLFTVSSTLHNFTS